MITEKETIVINKAAKKNTGDSPVLSPTRILMLVPHEPDADPRIKWVTELCAQVGRTDIIGFTYSVDDKPAREYHDLIYTERANLYDYLPGGKVDSLRLRIVRSLYNWLNNIPQRLAKTKEGLRSLRHPWRTIIGSKRLGEIGYLTIKNLGLESSLRPRLKRLKARILASDQPITELSEAETNKIVAQAPLVVEAGESLQTESIESELVELPAAAEATVASEKERKHLNTFQNLLRRGPINKSLTYVGAQMEAVGRFISNLESFYLISETLYRRARTVSIIPQYIICHDLYALIAGVKLKKLYNCALVYDSHELWPEAFLDARNWEKKLIAFMEHRLVKHADVVITVNPQIARYLEGLYRITGVLSVPNAEPFTGSTANSRKRSLTLPLKFLLQGRVVPNRGTEELLEAWSQLADDRAVLIIRSPETAYYTQLQNRFWADIEKGRVVIAPPVTEAELVSAATSADVGVIPYPGPNLCHVYACPNKLSQYMQAGLAILNNADQEFVSEVVNQYKCGLSYNPTQPASLIKAVQYLIDNPVQLQAMKNNAYECARSEFNWTTQSEVYLETLQNLYHNGNID